MIVIHCSWELTSITLSTLYKFSTVFLKELPSFFPLIFFFSSVSQTSFLPRFMLPNDSQPYRSNCYLNIVDYHRFSLGLFIWKLFQHQDAAMGYIVTAIVKWQYGAKLISKMDLLDWAPTIAQINTSWLLILRL